ncbi:hypothetical protein ACIA8E_36375 [Streptomyces sp. NPDC051664]|uniref:hypothetical protein n=1 Tax=Streptomyces sp. NPDC051664 TaxID=3365668 RepID=UPI00379AD787
MTSHRTGADRATAHRYFDDFVLRRLPAALATARQDTVTAAVTPLAEMFADAERRRAARTRTKRSRQVGTSRTSTT